MWIQSCVTLALLLSLSLSVAGQSTPARRVDVLERGTYRADTLARTPMPGTTGVINTIQNARLISSSTSIPGLLGVRFGLRYLLRGESAALVPLRLVIVFPPAGLRNPTTGQTFFSSEHTVSVRAGASLYWEYSFENQWEIVPGLWQFEFWEGETKLGEQRFCVYGLGANDASSTLPRECRSALLG